MMMALRVEKGSGAGRMGLIREMRMNSVWDGVSSECLWDVCVEITDKQLQV